MKLNLDTDYIIPLPFDLGDTIYSINHVYSSMLINGDIETDPSVEKLRVTGYKIKRLGVILEFQNELGRYDFIKIADGSMVYREGFLHENYMYRTQKEADEHLDILKKEIRRRKKKGEIL